MLKRISKIIHAHMRACVCICLRFFSVQINCEWQNTTFAIHIHHSHVYFSCDFVIVHISRISISAFIWINFVYLIYICVYVCVRACWRLWASALLKCDSTGFIASLVRWKICLFCTFVLSFIFAHTIACSQSWIFSSSHCLHINSMVNTGTSR